MKLQAIFLDRDGVINEDVPLISRASQIRLFPGAAKALKRLNDGGILAIVVTNQPVVARNLCTEDELIKIHDHLKKMLKDEAGAKLDAIYYCPHHPEKNHPDGNPVYRIDCGCRKPKTGMIEQAKKDFKLDLSGCVLIGDSSRDIMAGKNAGLKTILIKHDNPDGEAAEKLCPDLVVGSLAEAVNRLLA